LPSLSNSFTAVIDSKSGVDEVNTRDRIAWAKEAGDSHAPKAPKYANEKTMVDGVKFASKAEARRYQELCLLCKAGKIRSLVLQPRWPLTIKGELICTYIADFEYYDVEQKKWIVEDVKGWATPVYKLKAKLMHAIHGILVQEITN
jgi:hypothetical protein